MISFYNKTRGEEMNRDDLIISLLILAVFFVFFNVGGDVFFQGFGLTYIGNAGIFLILLVVIIFLWQRRRKGAMV